MRYWRRSDPPRILNEFLARNHSTPETGNAGQWTLSRSRVPHTPPCPTIWGKAWCVDAGTSILCRILSSHVGQSA